MIYRIHPNIKDVLMLAFDGDKAREALGEDTDFHIDERPISYYADWQPMEIRFSDAFGGKKKKETPDISLNVGKLFLSEKAFDCLKNLIEANGELLPVRYDNKTGYIFNGLTTIKHNEKLSTHDPMNNSFSIIFDESDTACNSIFKTEIDYSAYFCQNEFKRIVEKNNLTGINFSEDIGNPFPVELSMRVEH